MIKTILKNKRLLNFFIYGSGQAFNLISPLIVIPYIVLICGEDGFGKVNLGFSMALFLILIVDYGFEIKSPKEVSENRENPNKLQEIANITFYSKFVIFIVVFLAISILIWFVPFLYSERLLYFFSTTIILAQVFNPCWFLQGLENFRLVSAINIASKVTYVIFVYIFLKYKGDYIYVNMVLGLSSLIFNIIFLIYVIKKYHLNLLKPNVKEIRAVLRADFSLCISQLFLSARQLSPFFIVSYFLGYVTGGQYAIIERVLSMFRTFIQVFLRFFYPSVCYKISKNVVEGFTFWKKYTGYSILIMCTGATTLYFFSVKILLFFNVANDGVATLDPVFRVALIIPFIMALSYPLEQLMFVINRNKAYVRIIMSVAAITIVLMLLVVNNYGIISIVLSLLLSEMLVAALYFKYSYLFLKGQIEKENVNA
ncbi:hypothetical protein Q765_14455 [Flavobacterium rivuli WB 3.3-2 = DSM 21788]|uniref:Polysaccharide biosynthesis protein C-terminal domain-containing protein n=1 Tax=Flavobacterium rivuli WB 3.3-2 = DSM 21788 TaxID=1121895 RepID=A0A0A2M2Y0_9FLAO|nr:oligosaccharide flippase family protein [Flavobacterium rivuli]KGO85823.1 hypothetical protein Q765_14455 [Flavobacterium rivuli WB 3.3-2 = DSM 21788]